MLKDASFSLKSYSWEIRNDLCAIKTVDKTLLLEGTTGIPLDVVPFFAGRKLSEGETDQLEFDVFGELASCSLSRKQGRHRLFFGHLKKRLEEYGIELGDLLFFERDSTQFGRFAVLALKHDTCVIFQPSLDTEVGENREIYSTSRVGQEIFREQVRATYNYRCCLSDVDDIQPSILVASHIKPWKLASGIEKVDRYNGLLLAPHYDKLFDKGLISFSDSGNILLSSALTDQMVDKWDLEDRNLRFLHPKTADYLAFHRDHFRL